MTRWKYRIRFRDLLDKEPDYYDDIEKEKKAIQEIGQKMFSRLSLYRFLRFPIIKFKTVKTEASFNRLLSQLYDYCDENQIWVEWETNKE
jgi:hypothetical protein